MPDAQAGGVRVEQVLCCETIVERGLRCATATNLLELFWEVGKMGTGRGKLGAYTEPEVVLPHLHAALSSAEKMHAS